MFKIAGLKYLTMTVLLTGIFAVAGAAESPATTWTGTVESLDQDNGFINVSGQTLRYSDHETEVSLQGRVIGSHVLQAGMVIRYSLTSQGVLAKIELLGPDAMLRRFQQH